MVGDGDSHCARNFEFAQEIKKFDTLGLPIYENKQSNHQTMKQLFHCFNK